MMGPFIAVDWGTSNRRIFVIDDAGDVIHRDHDHQGVLATKNCDFAAAAQAIRDRHGGLPMLCAGMIGSNIGWVDAGYVKTSATTGQLAQSICWTVPGEVGIVPGVRHTDGEYIEVMRGEETQLAGMIASGCTAPLYCLPGTHCKWATVDRTGITKFRTTMTGEIFALLRDHSTLAKCIGVADWSDSGFQAGMDDAARGNLLSMVFQARSHAASKAEGARRAPGYVSGLLIGTDVRDNAKAETVCVIGTSPLAQLYVHAIERLGTNAMVVDDQTAFVAGMRKIMEDLN